MATSLINTECKRYGCMKNLLACYANCRYSTRCDDLRNEIVNNADQASTDINKYLSERGKTPVVIQLMKRGLKFSETTAPNVLSSNKRLSGLNKNPATEIPGITMKSAPRLADELAASDKPVKISTSGIKKNRKKSSKARKARLIKSKASNTEIATVKLSKAQSASYLGKPPVVLSRKKVAKQKPRPGNKKRLTSGKRSVEKLPAVLMKNRKSSVMPRRSKNEINALVADNEQGLNTPAHEQGVNGDGKGSTARPARSKKRPAVTRGRSAERNGKVYIILDGKSASVVNEQGLMSHLFTNPSSSARYFEASEVEARVQITKK